MDHPAYPHAAPAAPTTSQPSLVPWLLGRGDPPSAGQLRAAGVAAYACSVLPKGHPQRAPLRADYMQAVARHLCVKKAVVSLLDAWERAGVQALLFKGFHLAEFVYPVAAARTYADVDLLLRDPRDEAAARRAAELAGWRVDFDSAEVGQERFHTAFELTCPRTGLSVDVHRFAVPGPGLRTKRRLTAAVWARARAREWEGLRVWEMDPVDALLSGLVLARAWGVDGWGIRPHDALDWRLLGERCGVDDAALDARARELGCARTLRLFRERLDPARGRVQLGLPSPAWARRARLLSATESVCVASALMRATHVPSVAAEVAAALPYVFRARRALRAAADLPQLLRSLAPAGPGRDAPATRLLRFRAIRGVRWAARLLPTPAGRGGQVRALALFAALRDQGWAVSFVSGERVDGGHRTPHTWLELDGRMVPGLHEPTPRAAYLERFRYP